MTSSACHLGEPTLKSGVTAKTSLITAKARPSESCYLSKELEVYLSATDQISSLGQFQKLRTGSSDSGRLSLISSFGSLSLGGYNLGSNHPYSIYPSSSDSASRQSMSVVDLDQHKFYCSLMLLNSLDLSHLEHQKPCDTQQTSNQIKASLPSIQTQNSISIESNLVGSDSVPIASNLKLRDEHLRDSRLRWFIARISSSKRIEQDRRVATKKGEKSKITAGDSYKKQSSGLNILSSSWQGQGAGKLVAAAAAATNSTGFVDKLLSHMIKRNGRSAPSSMSSVSSQYKEQAMTMSSNKSSGTNKTSGGSNCGDSFARNSSAVIEQPKKQKASQTGGAIQLLSDFSRRLARRCGVKTKAAQIGVKVGATDGAGNDVDSCISELETSNSSSGLDREVNIERKSCSELKGTRTTCCGATAANQHSKVLPTCADGSKIQHERGNRSQVDDSNARIAHQTVTLGSNEARQQLTRVCSGFAPHSCPKQPTCEQHRTEHQLQVQASAVRNNTLAQPNNSNSISSKNEVSNASNSTLSTAASQHCFCDNETCSSSGFVSSSTTCGGGCGAISGSGGGSSSRGCTGGIRGGNCGDSNATIHSCNSSTYEEPISITTPASPGVSKRSTAGASSRGANPDSKVAPATSLLGCLLVSYPQHIHSTSGCQQSKNLSQIQTQQDHQSEAAMAAASPNYLAAEANPQLTVAASEGINLSIPRDHRDEQQIHQPITEIQIFTVEDQDETKSDKVEDKKQNQEQSQHRDNNKSHLKPKTSLLTRARNSTINLASLATVTNRFSSASVGNLWHGAGGHSTHSDYAAGELATDDSSGGRIKPLDYIAHGAFDCYQDDSHNSPAATEPKSISSSSSNRLLSVASCGSTRKLSTKEKCKRQKEAERVERLKQLVSYLKSGSSQPLVSPIALEPDDIELAERYKLQVTLRDGLFGELSTSGGEQQQQQQPNQFDQSHSCEGVNKSLTDNQTTDAGHKITMHNSREQDAIAKKSSLINQSIGGTTTSSPASSSSSSSMNQAHHPANNGRSIPHIGNVTWVLRHSISDPGSNFEHSPAFSVASSSPSTRDQQRHHHHHNHHHNHHCNHPTHDNHLQHRPNAENTEKNQDIQYHSNSCAPSSSYSGSSLSNYCLAMGSNTVNGGNVMTPVQQSTSNHDQLPKLFYIDDMDMIPTFSSSSLVNAVTGQATAAPAVSRALIQTSTPIASTASTNCCSQVSTPAIVMDEVSLISTTNKNSCSTSSTSAWTQPQNLATWIDNEVNSLVSDLESKSQQLNESKHNKSGKRKWLSVTGNHSSRRSSSGAHST